MNEQITLAHCPLGNCHWRSEPLENEQAAREASRAHLNAHTHGDLVTFASAFITLDRYAHVDESGSGPST